MADRSTIINLRMIAAVAEKLANDLERGSLWPGEASDAISQIAKAVNDLPKGRSQ